VGAKLDSNCNRLKADKGNKMAKFRPLMLAPPVLFVALAVLFYAGNFREDRLALPSAQQGRTAPPVVLTQLGDLPTFDDATLRDGNVKLVNFWASWCAPCRAEHPILEAMSAEGLQILGVNYRDDAGRGLGFLQELGNPFMAVGADPSGRMAIDWGLYGVPETYVIAGDGTIVLRFAGPITQEVLASRIRPAIAEAEAMN
jgi:cytochrome c biogenesis protein CcmG/thiol:disulfide interchange protein DsbE